MTTFDKLKGAAATLADAAVKTTGDLAQKGKKQMDLLALENKLSRAQRQLGALVYALHKNGEENTALVERYIETIAAVEKDIAALEPAPAAAMADDAQTAVYCPPAVSYTHLRAHETRHDLVCRLLLEKKTHLPSPRDGLLTRMPSSA